MIGSVRAQLTVAVAVVVGVITLAAALVAPKVVRESLIDDRLDAQRELESAEMATGSIAIWQRLDPTALGPAELTALFGPEVAAVTSELDAIDALDQLRAVDPDRRLHVLAGPDIVATVTLDGRVRVQVSAPEATTSPVVSQERLQRLAADHGIGRGFDTSLPLLVDGSLSFESFLDQMAAEFAIDLGDYLDPNVFEGFPGFDADEQLIPPDVFEILRDEFPTVDGAPERAAATNDLAVGTRTVAGRPMLLTASLDGIDESVARVRTLLWFTLPVAMAAAAVLTWLLAGRSLRPVAVITERTRQIRSSTLHERVPVPPSGDEITALATEMNEMLDRVQREDSRRRQFVSDASHELRSPLASIRAQAEAARVDHTQAELAEGVLAEAERMSSLVDDLLALARADEQRAAPHRLVDLDDLVYEEASRSRRVVVDVSSVSAGQVLARPDELARMLTHLLDNAARHARNRVEVSLATADDGQVVLTVDDDGDGIAPDDRERVFERFVRLDDARDRDRGGSGLGLSVVDAIARSAGARVRITDAPLGGARFEVHFPRPAGIAT